MSWNCSLVTVEQPQPHLSGNSFVVWDSSSDLTYWQVNSNPINCTTRSHRNKRNRQHSCMRWWGAPAWSGCGFQAFRPTCWEGCCDGALVSSACHSEAGWMLQNVSFFLLFLLRESVKWRGTPKIGGKRKRCRKTRLLFSPLSLPVIRRAQLPTHYICCHSCTGWALTLSPPQISRLPSVLV